MIDRKEKILSAEEVQKILANHFGFPEEHTTLWFEGNAGPNKYILRLDRDCAGIDGDPTPEMLLDDRGLQAGVQP